MSNEKSPPLAHLVFTEFENNLFKEMEEDRKLDQLMDQLFPWDLETPFRSGGL